VQEKHYRRKQPVLERRVFLAEAPSSA
jgi:hypothetical protein